MEKARRHEPPGLSEPRGSERMLPDQKLSFAANWMLRSVVPHSEQDGLDSIDVIVPTAALPIVVFGLRTAGG